MTSVSTHVLDGEIDCSLISTYNLERFKIRFPHESEKTLVRFLAARKGNVEQATELLLRHIEWRSAIYPISKSSIAHEIKKGKYYSYGYDKEGHPLIIWRTCFHDPDNRVLEEQAKSLFWWFQKFEDKMPENKCKITVLCDQTNLVQDEEFLKYIIPIFQDNFPERLHKFIVFPTSVFFWAFLQFLKIYLDPVTASKFAVLSNIEEVREFIDNEYIPVSLGGGCDYVFNADDFDDYGENIAELANKTSITSPSNNSKEVIEVLLDNEGGSNEINISLKPEVILPEADGVV